MSSSDAVPRHRTALSRGDISRPVRVAIRDGVLRPGRTVTDYGCGLGGDGRRLGELGYDCASWDPVHAPGGNRRTSDVVNLGYVVNVIEDEAERAGALRAAWDLARRVLVVSARTEDETPARGSAVPFADGFVTRLGTFQKFFEQGELRDWIDRTLDGACVAAAPGIFYLFRDVGDRSAFVASRFSRAPGPSRVRTEGASRVPRREALDEVARFVSLHGRPPSPEELSLADEAVLRPGGIGRAVGLLRRAREDRGWDEARRTRSQDLLVYLALSRFDRPPTFGDLPRSMQLDVKAFFGSHAAARRSADEQLYALGDPERLDAACRSATFGKLMPEALYVHVDFVNQLPTALRLYEGCARHFLGDVDGATVVKLRRSEPKVSYLSYPGFDSDPHPALAASVNVDLRTFRVRSRSWSAVANPPVLHRKEAFVPRDHPDWPKFSRLTSAEVAKGLFDEPSAIGTRDGWIRRLAEGGVELRGHRLVRSRRGLG